MVGSISLCFLSLRFVFAPAVPLREVASEYAIQQNLEQLYDLISSVTGFQSVADLGNRLPIRYDANVSAQAYATWENSSVLEIPFAKPDIILLVVESLSAADSIRLKAKTNRSSYVTHLDPHSIVQQMNISMQNSKRAGNRLRMLINPNLYRY